VTIFSVYLTTGLVRIPIMMSNILVVFNDYPPDVKANSTAVNLQVCHNPLFSRSQILVIRENFSVSFPAS
jgi:hypothetical protein